MCEKRITLLQELCQDILNRWSEFNPIEPVRVGFDEHGLPQHPNLIEALEWWNSPEIREQTQDKSPSMDVGTRMDCMDCMD